MENGNKETMVVQRSPVGAYSEKQRMYAYRLACQILEIQRPKPNLAKGYSEDEPRLMLRNFTIEQLKDALAKIKAGEDVKFDYA